MARNQNIGQMVNIALVLALAGSSAAWAVVDCRLEKYISAHEGRVGPCKFDAQKKSFEGTPSQQANCLTREVMRMGKIGEETITPFLNELVGKPAPSVQSVQALLESQQIKPVDVGGPIIKSILANYFIIHDTSTPNCSEKGPPASCPKRGEFPTNLNNESWIFNKNFGGHPKSYPDRLAHVFTNRLGASITEVDFADHIATTKFESCVDGAVKTKLFVGVENIQPRIGDPKIPKRGKKANDFDAPNPGFTTKQYERLAMLYIVASARRGQWLIPAFHAVLDQFYADQHDDPQRFDMTAFSAAIQKYSEVINEKALAWQTNLPTVQVKDDIPKRSLPALNAVACENIANNASLFRVGKTTKTTQYFTPLLRPGPDGGLREEERTKIIMLLGRLFTFRRLRAKYAHRAVNR